MDGSHNFGSIAIAVVPRDRFSVFPRCLEALFANTDIPFRIVVVSGGTDKETKDYLYGLQAEHTNLSVVLSDRLLLQGEARNLAMKQIQERFCVVLENDTIVHRNWIIPMLQCMREEGAAAVMPLILWYGHIHAAGCLFEETENSGQLLFKHKILYTGIKRRRVDYPECHCVLIDRQRLPDTEIFEDVEPFDVDLGLTLRKRRLSVFIEPTSVVTYSALPGWKRHDVQLFKFRWDPVSWEARNRMFMNKWAISYDPSRKLASYRRQQLRLGLAHWYPNKFALALSNAFVSMEKYLLSTFLPGDLYAPSKQTNSSLR